MRAKVWRRRDRVRRGNGRFRTSNLVCAGCVIAGILGGALGVEAQTPTPTLTLDEVLFRVSQSVLSFELQFGDRVADESYEQRIVTADGEITLSRRYASQVLFHRNPQADTWTSYRRVTEVDGEHIERMWMDPGDEPPTLAEFLVQAIRTDEQSARHFIAPMPWNLHMPLLALVFVHPLNRYRSQFEKVGEEVVNGQRVWLVRFHEHRSPTFIRDRGNDLFSTGTYWVMPEDGRIVRSDLLLGASVTNRQGRTRITVDYRPVGDRGAWLPTEMREAYDNPLFPGSPRTEGHATFSNFRQFVLEDEALLVDTP